MNKDKASLLDIIQAAKKVLKFSQGYDIPELLELIEPMITNDREPS